MVLTFSVITPSFCQGQFIERTIHSVLLQRSDDIEIDYIICDGGSNDETISVLEKYNSDIRWLSEPDQGQADAVNKGISLSNGDIIAWINSDDIYYPGTFNAVRQVFESNSHVSVVYGDADHINERDEIIEAYPTKIWNYERLKETCFLCQPAVFFRRSVVEKLGNLDSSLKYCMDYELWLRWGKHMSFYYLPKKLSGSRLYRNNKTLGQRVYVHYEINQMFLNKFRRVPEKWIFAYAHVKVEEKFNFDLSTDQGNFQFLGHLSYNSLWAFWNWKQPLSLKAICKIGFWYFSYQMLFFKLIFTKQKQ